MKLYAIRDKKTKKLSLLAESPMGLWESFGMAEYALSIYCDPQTDEVITLRIEPTEPCEFCRDPDDLIVARYKPRKPGDPDPMMVAVEALDPELCPMCGRRLT